MPQPLNGIFNAIIRFLYVSTYIVEKPIPD
jgi:hypothetical protein